MAPSSRRTVLTACTLAVFVTMVARLVISPVVPGIADEFAVPTTAIGSRCRRYGSPTRGRSAPAGCLATGSVGVGLIADLFGWLAALLALAGVLGTIPLGLFTAAVWRRRSDHARRVKDEVPGTRRGRMNLDATLDVDVNGTVVFTFRVTNAGTEPAELTFRSGRDGDVAVRRDGEEVWRFSEGRMFTQAIRTTTLRPGETYETEYEWADPTPGDYTAVATLAVEAPVEAQAEFHV